jgi:ABC-type transport system involved in multi-copper enzyme maturation permease subunit
MSQLDSFRQPVPGKPNSGGPSDLLAEDRSLPPTIGACGAVMVMVGLFAVAMHFAERSFPVGPAVGLVGALLGFLLLVVHATLERSDVILLAYLGLGAVLMAAGLVALVNPRLALDARALGVGGFLAGLPLALAAARSLGLGDSPGRDPSRRLAALWAPRVVGLLGAGGALLGILWLFVLAERGEFTSIGLPTVLSLLGLVAGLGYLGLVGFGSDGANRLGWLACYVGMGLALAILARSGLHAWGLWKAQGSSHFIPGGWIILALSLLVGLGSFSLVSDSPAVVIFRREMASFFLSPIAYFVMMAFALGTWTSYSMFLDRLADRQVLEPILGQYVIELFIVLCVLFGVPLLTMRLLSEEKRSGTLEVLLTAPVDESSIVLGKFFAALVTYLIIWLPFGLYLLALPVTNQPGFDYRPLLSYSVALVVSGAGFIALGLALSSLSSNQLISGALTLTAMILLLAPYILQFRQGIEGTTWSTVLQHVSFLNLWESSLEGKLVPRQLVFHLSLAVLSLFVATKVLEARRWQ